MEPEITIGIEDIKRLSLKPTDILVVKINHADMPTPWFAAYKEKMKETISGAGYSNEVLILGPDVELSVMEQEHGG